MQPWPHSSYVFDSQTWSKREKYKVWPHASYPSNLNFKQPLWTKYSMILVATISSAVLIALTVMFSMQSKIISLIEGRNNVNYFL